MTRRLARAHARRRRSPAWSSCADLGRVSESSHALRRSISRAAGRGRRRRRVSGSDRDALADCGCRCLTLAERDGGCRACRCGMRCSPRLCRIATPDLDAAMRQIGLAVGQHFGLVNASSRRQDSAPVAPDSRLRTAEYIQAGERTMTGASRYDRTRACHARQLAEEFRNAVEHVVGPQEQFRNRLRSAPTTTWSSAATTSSTPSADADTATASSS